MLSQLRRGHYHEFDGDPMSVRTLNGHGERWKSPDRTNASFVKNNILPDLYTARSNFSTWNPDLSRAFRVDAQLLAIVRIEDRRNNFYSAEVVSKLRQQEQTQKFINKPCSLFVTDRSFIIYDRGAQVIAETVPLENVDPTCVYSDAQDTLNDIFMYRVLDRHAAATSPAHNTNNNEITHAIVFKCSNKESKLLVDNIRHANGKVPKGSRTARSETRSATDRRFMGTDGLTFYNSQTLPHEPIIMNSSIHTAGPQPSSRSTVQQHPSENSRRLIQELNKCFDDIESFVRHIEALMEYTKELERDNRRREKKSSGLKQMIEKLPDDRIFIDILQKFKHSFNLLAELKHIIHSPNAPELVHYLLSPLQLILITLRSKHPHQLQLAQEIWSPVLTREARELLVNCLTSKEQEILHNLGPAWIRTAEEIPQKVTDYRPVFFEGRQVWYPEPPNDYSIHSARSIDERQPSNWSSPRLPPPINNNNNNASLMSQRTTTPRRPSPGKPIDSSTVDRSNKNPALENYNLPMQTELSWAADRKRVGAKICLVKFDRQGHNSKELTVKRDELIEIENSSKNWWRARNSRGEVGHVPHNILEEVDLDYLTAKNPTTNTSAFIPRSSSVPNRGFAFVDGHHQRNTNGYADYLLRSPSFGNNFIMQSSNSTYTNPAMLRDPFPQQAHSSAVPPPPPPTALAVPLPPPPPPPPPMPSELLRNPTSPWSTLQVPNSNRKGRPPVDTDLSSTQIDELQQELTQRLTDRIGLINTNSSKNEVQRWLASKTISPELAQRLQGMNGEQLFQLSKGDLDQMTNEQESARVYALLSQQKQLAGYRSQETLERTGQINTNTFGSLKSNTINDADDNFSSEPKDTLNRSLKIKLKQRRDKIDKAQSNDRTEL